MLVLHPATAATFAEATRLTPAEATSLTLTSLAARYPPVNLQFRGRQRRVHGVFVKENWIFSRFTRYCPQCLAGDGSLIQQRHGGAWSRLWRLPVVFACPTTSACSSTPAQPAAAPPSTAHAAPKRYCRTKATAGCTRPRAGTPSPPPTAVHLGHAGNGSTRNTRSPHPPPITSVNCLTSKTS
jgi:hypothetical protein